MDDWPFTYSSFWSEPQDGMRDGCPQLTPGKEKELLSQLKQTWERQEGLAWGVQPPREFGGRV